jgi:hypothetical protein
MKIYKCVTTCTWNGRYWEEGTLTDPIPDDVKPPKHFEQVTNPSEIQEVLDGIDEEDDPKTFTELSQQLMDVGNTGVGMCAGDDLQLKNLEQLKAIAKEKNVYNSGLRTKDALIEAIESAE